MKIHEGLKLSLRGIVKRPVESALLVLGIALGIGAAAAGLSMISNSIDSKNSILDLVQYKEIVVQTRENAADMELPAAPGGGDEDVILGTNDLAAKDDVLDVEFGYLLEETQFRLSGFQTGPRGEAPPNDIDPLPVVDGPEPVLDEIHGLRISPEYFEAYGVALSGGALFTDVEMAKDAKVMVIGSELAETLFEDGVALGRELAVFQALYTIIGVLQPTGSLLDESAMVPAEVVDVASIQAKARGLFGGGATLHFTVYDSTRLDEAKAQLGLWFDQKYGEGQVAISIPRTEVEAAQDRTTRLVTLILVLAVSALLIASVNVSHILAGRAMRRRRSVGILKALGASAGNVFTLFFFEAFVIGTAGAILGFGVSVGISMLIAGSASEGAIISLALGVGIVVAWCITSILTVIPAVQTSKIPAAVALSY